MLDLLAGSNAWSCLGLWVYLVVLYNRVTALPILPIKISISFLLKKYMLMRIQKKKVA
jgi:hypothetical protein